MADSITYTKKVLPFTSDKRSTTDIFCTIISSLFAISLFITSLVVWDKSEFDRKFSNTSLGPNQKFCPQGEYILLNNNYKFSESQCVKNCGEGLAPVESSICMPLVQADRQVYLKNPEISQIWNRKGFSKTLVYGGIAVIGLGLLWALLVKLTKARSVTIALLGAVVGLIAVGILLMMATVLSQTKTFKIVLAGVCFAIAIILIVIAAKYHMELKFQQIFMEYAVTCIGQNGSTIVYLPIFLLLGFGLIALCAWQQCSFASYKAPSYSSIYDLSSSGILGLLNMIQFFWGIHFLQDAYCFIISGIAVQWYWTGNHDSPLPFRRLFRYNWGSVAGGSFLNAFFQIPSLLIQLLVCHPNGCCVKAGKTCNYACGNGFYDIVRRDSYAFQNLVGIPICNSARDCSVNCEQYQKFIGTQSPIKHTRFATYVFLMCLSMIMGYLIMQNWCYQISGWNVVISAAIFYLLLVFFTDLWLNAAEGLQTSYLFDFILQKKNSHKLHAHRVFKNQLSPIQISSLTDGQC